MILKNASFLITMDRNNRIIRNGGLYIEGNRIVDVGKSEKIVRKYKDDEVIDCKGKLIMPGLINTHTHASMVLFRGLGEDMELMEWLETKIWPMEAKLKPRDVYYGSLLAMIEMVRGGVTTFVDMYFFMDEVAKACEEIGIRGVLSWAVVDKEITTQKGDPVKNAERFIKTWKNHELVKPAVGPHAIYTCSKETLLNAKDVAEKYETLLHIHLSETRKEVYDCWKKRRKRPVEYLEGIGFLGSNVLAAHCVWLTKEEVKILAKSNVKVSHCPVSNMKLASGVAPIPEMLTHGITVGLGTDGAASNNSLDMFETMKFASLLQKLTRWDPTVTKARDILKMATVNGAKCIGLSNSLGSIERGKLADLILIDIESARWKPCYDPIANLIYSSKPCDVTMTIVNGRVIMKNGKVKGVKEEKVISYIEKVTSKWERLSTFKNYKA